MKVTRVYNQLILATHMNLQILQKALVSGSKILHNQPLTYSRKLLLQYQFPDTSALFYIKADSSDFAIRAVLSYASKKDSKQYLVVFFSKSFFLVKCNYDIYNKEMLAIICALEKWCYFQEEVVISVEIYKLHDLSTNIVSNKGL